jgi:hypothetical protein
MVGPDPSRRTRTKNVVMLNSFQHPGAARGSKDRALETCDRAWILKQVQDDGIRRDDGGGRDGGNEMQFDGRTGWSRPITTSRNMR